MSVTSSAEIREEAMNSVSFSAENPLTPPPQSRRLFQASGSNSFIEFMKEEIEQSIPARFEKQVDHYPDQIAVKTRDQTLTYDQLNRLANRVAHALVQRQHLTGEPVAFLLGHGLRQIITILGILKAGKIYVPLDPTFPANRLAALLEDAEATVIITDSENRTLAQELTANTRDVLAIDDLDPHLPDTNLGLTIPPNAIVNIIYTSGSTGRPKGVIHNHRVMLHNVMSATNTYGLSSDDRIVLLSSVGFSASFTPLFGSLLNGATLLPYNLKDDGFAQLINWLVQERITFYDSVPSTFRRFVTTLPETAQFPHLRIITLGGEPVYKRDVDLYKKYFSDSCLFCVRLAGTEMRTVCFYLINKTTQLETATVPVGYADVDKEILLLDVDGQEVAINEIGEIAVKSRYLATGYWRNPQLTHAAFQPSPHNPEERIYHTGDLGRMRADGCLEHLGRKDSQVKIRGHRVEIGEVEMALLDLDGVKEVAVAVKEDQAGQKRLVAYLIPTGTAPLSHAALRAALANVLPAYMLPSHFVFLESLPFTTTGKVDYRALPEPPRTRPDLQTAFLAPRTTVEIELQQMWQEILGIQPIGVQDDFFDLGGDSLAAVEVLTRIEHTFHVNFPPDVFVQAPTIEHLANLLGPQEHPNSQSLLVAIQPYGPQPPFFCTPGYGGNVLRLRSLGSYFAPDRPFYGFRDPRLEHERISFARIEDLARHYVNTLLTSQPQGPYYLGGYSFGCFVAFEMAQQLRRSGHQVKALFFLDLPHSGRPQNSRSLLGAKLLFPGKQQEQSTTFTRVMNKLLLLTKRFTPNFLFPLSLLEANILAKTSYVPKRYSGRIIFFQTSRNQDVPRLWAPLAAGGIESHEIPGDHETMLREPHVQILAEKLKARLARLQMDSVTEAPPKIEHR